LIRINLNARGWGDDVDPRYRTVSVDPDKVDPVVLFSDKKQSRDANHVASAIADLAFNDADHIYMPLWAPVGGYNAGTDYRLQMYRVDVNTGTSEAIERGGKYTLGWIMDGSGKLVARFDNKDSPLTDIILVPDGSDWREIARTDASGGKGFDIGGVSIDGKSLVLGAVTFDNENTKGLALMSLADGKQSQFYTNPLYDIDGIIGDPWTNRVVGAVVTQHLGRAVYFDPVLQQIQDTLEADFPGTAVFAVSWDTARNKVVFSVDGPVSPPTLYLFNRQTKAITKLGRTYPQLQSTDLGQVQVYNYKARDGLEIPAYLTLPPGKTPKNLPVVIMPHGGPMARDSMHFDWERQFLANRGYAVLQPNYRGSTGYGRKFEEAGYGEWGLKMQDDITDGVKKMIADGIADPKRICIVGGSYGGYAALAGAALTPDLYACAASWAGISDLPHMLATDTKGADEYSAYVSSIIRFIGDRRSDAKKLDAASPLKNVAKIKIPILLMHGEADSTVRIDQSENMNRVMQDAKKKVTFIRIPNETHHMKLASSRIRWLTELEKFLKENIGN